MSKVLFYKIGDPDYGNRPLQVHYTCLSCGEGINVFSLITSELFNDRVALESYISCISNRNNCKKCESGEQCQNTY
jgi:hypothetical protein